MCARVEAGAEPLKYIDVDTVGSEMPVLRAVADGACRVVRAGSNSGFSHLSEAANLHRSAHKPFLLDPERALSRLSHMRSSITGHEDREFVKMIDEQNSSIEAKWAWYSDEQGCRHIRTNVRYEHDEV
jgi:hypothetical protein